MRVATYNVHDCIGNDGRYDPGRVAAVLAELEVDLLALQEVTLGGDGEPAGRFEAATGLTAVDGAVLERGRGRYGNLLLSREVPLGVRRHELSYPGREPRGVLEVRLQPGARPVGAYVTHLGLGRRERRWQLARLSALLAEDPGALLVLGDFNVWQRQGDLAVLAAAGLRQVVVRSFPTRPFPLAPLDRVLAREPLAIQRCWRHESPLARLASDHFPVLAELAFAD